MLNYTVKYNNIILPPRLPNEYLEVDYIMNSASGYVDFNLNTYINNISRAYFKVEFSVLNAGSHDVHLLGGRAGSGSGYFSFFTHNTSSKLVLLYSASNSGATRLLDTTTKLTLNTLYEVESKLASGGLYCKINGVTKVSNTYTSTMSNSFIAHIGAWNGAGTISTTYCWQGKIYSIKLYDSSNSLLFDLIPCYRKVDNIVGLYNLVNNTFYTNSGTSVFTAGPNTDYEYIYTSPEPVASVSIIYNDIILTTLTDSATVILPTKDKYCDKNITVGTAILPTATKCLKDDIIIIAKS